MAMMHAAGGTPRAADRERRLGSWGCGWALLLASMVCCAGFAELAARAFWRARYGVPFGDPGRILYAFYPGVREVDWARPARGDGVLDILFLGGSTLHREWGAVEQELRERLAYEGYQHARVFNLARPAQTSRDSVLQYAALDTARFDMVVLYDGLNDARANNAPPEIFRRDYSHYSWYEIVNALASLHARATFSLPYTVRYLAFLLHQRWAPARYAPTHWPRAEWVRYGRTPRSAASFKGNLRTILDLAAQRGDPVLLMTFAAYVPAGYSREAFDHKRLDYGLHLRPVELWGAPGDVLRAVAVHNGIVRRAAARSGGVVLADTASTITSSRYFNDVCHLTVAGSHAFAMAMADAMLARLAGRPY